MLRRLHLALSLALAAIFIVPAGAQVVVSTYSSTIGNTLNATGVLLTLKALDTFVPGPRS